MTTLGILAADERRQRTCARLAGFLFLWLIVTGLAGAITISRINGSGPFPEMAKRVIASEGLYRVALCSALVETLSALLLGFALYVTLLSVDELLARLAMYWRIGESFIGCVAVIAGFVRLRLVSSSQSPGALSAADTDALVRLFRHAGSVMTNVAAISFSIGSLIFYYLFWKSRYIPRALAALGVVASVLVAIVCFGTLLFPEYGSTLQYGWAPMAIAEVATGVWLMIYGVRTRAAVVGSA